MELKAAKWDQVVQVGGAEFDGDDPGIAGVTPCLLCRNARAVGAFADRVIAATGGDNAVDLPGTGVFEVENGKIEIWRDCFDMATFTTAMS